MRTLTIDLEHCYGIRRLTATLDFTKTSAIAIYAPNGSMKTSLAQTFQDIASDTASRDRIFPARACTRNVKDETGAELPKESVLVVRPYEEAMCRVPDEYLLKSKRPLLFGREVLTAVVAQWIHPDTTC